MKAPWALRLCVPALAGVLFLFLVDEAPAGVALRSGVRATTYYVNDGATGEPSSVCTAAGDDANDGLTTATPMRSIQALLDKYPSAGVGDTLWVDPGTYVENVAVGSSHSGLALQGAGSDAAVIDGNASGPCLTLTGFSSGAVTGFAFQNGNAPNGGGIFCDHSSPDISDNLVTGNTARFGGGIYCTFSAPAISGNTITNNTAAEGGGLYCYGSDATVTSNTITGNSATETAGGGIAVYVASPAIYENDITNNYAEGGGGGISCYYFANADITDNQINTNTTPGVGGGILCLSISNAIITGNTLSANSAGNGGGIYCGYYSSPDITSNSIDSNTGTFGGGIYSAFSAPTVSANQVTNNTAHEGGGLYCYGSDATVTSNTITGNSATETAGGGVAVYVASPTISGNTISYNSATLGGGGVSCYYNGDASLTGNSILGNTTTGYGGGLLCQNASSGPVTANIFADNSAENGGGLACLYSSSPSVEDGNVFHGNSASADGGAVYCYSYSSPSITHALMYDNSAASGTILCDSGSNPTIQHVTVADNSGGGIHTPPSATGPSTRCRSEPSISNSILWNNGDDLAGCSATYSCIQDGDAGAGNISLYPHFAASGPTGHRGVDYHLRSTAGRYDPGTATWVADDLTSPCVDAANPASSWSAEPFPNGRRANMGAFGDTAQASMTPSSVPSTYTLSVLAGGGDGAYSVLGLSITGTYPGTPPYSAQVAPNTEVTLTSPDWWQWTAGAGMWAKSVFTGWTINGEAHPADELTVTFTVTQNTEAVASYEREGTQPGPWSPDSLRRRPSRLSLVVAPVPQLLLIAGPDEVAAGQAAAYTATVIMTDGAAKDVTLAAAWAVAPETWCAVEGGLLAVSPDLSAPDAVALCATYTEDGVTVAASKIVALTAP